MQDNSLWVQNLGTSDVSLSDLGVKVPAGKTINVFKSNPYLTKAQVDLSLQSGALSKRITNGTVRLVTGPVAEKPHNLGKKLVSKEFTVRKTKTSVVIDASTPNEEGGEKFDFADYGGVDFENVVKHEKVSDSVVVSAKNDDAEPQPVSEKATMENLRQKWTDATGPLATTISPKDSPAVILKVVEQKEVIVAPVESKPMPKIEAAVAPVEKITKTQTGMVIVGEEPARSVRAVAKGTQDTEIMLDDQIEADKIIKDEAPKGMRVATKSKDGVIVMKLKEDEQLSSDKTVVSKPKSSKKT
jgi:hypothetical protein